MQVWSDPRPPAPGPTFTGTVARSTSLVSSRRHSCTGLDFLRKRKGTIKALQGLRAGIRTGLNYCRYKGYRREEVPKFLNILIWTVTRTGA